MRPVPSGGWAASLVCRGVLERGGVSPVPRAAEGSAEGASSEAEIAPLLVRPRMDRTVALVRGPSVYFEILMPEENLSHMLGCVLRRYLGGVLVPGWGTPNHGTRHYCCKVSMKLCHDTVH